MCIGLIFFFVTKISLSFNSVFHECFEILFPPQIQTLVQITLLQRVREITPNTRVGCKEEFFSQAWQQQLG